MKKNAGCLALALIAAGTMFSPAYGEGYSTWDNFDGVTEVDAHRWLGFERTRVVEGGQLRFVQRDLGSQTDEAGQFNNSWTSRLANPVAITRVRAVITVGDYAVSGCAKNSTPSRVAARIAGQFFNAGPGIPTSRLNNVGARLELNRYSDSGDAAGVLRVSGWVYQCTTTDCNYNAVDLAPPIDLGTAAVGEAVQLRLDWDQANKRFGFARGSNPPVYVNYSVADSQAAFNAFREIGTRTSLSNCFSGPRTEGFIDAKFDKVYVNISAVP